MNDLSAAVLADRQRHFAPVPAAVPRVLIPLFLASIGVSIFILVVVHNAALLVSVLVVAALVLGLFVWNASAHRRSLAIRLFLEQFPETDLVKANDGQLVKVTGVMPPYLSPFLFGDSLNVIVIGMAPFSCDKASPLKEIKLILMFASCGDFSLESSYEKAGRCVYTSTLLYEYHGCQLKQGHLNCRCFQWNLAYVERLTADFYITDAKSGIRALVKAGHDSRNACEASFSHYPVAMAVGISPLELAAFAWSSSASSSSSCSLDPCPSRRISQRNLYVRAAKRRRNARKGPQQNARLDLSRILRTEAAVLGVERKAGSAKFTRLWPRAVLEALDNSISANQWESALKGFNLTDPNSSDLCCNITDSIAVHLTNEIVGFLYTIDLWTGSETALSDAVRGLKPTLDVYTSLVGAYGHSGLLDKAISTLEEMNAISDCEPDAHTYTVLISSCCKLRRFELIPQLLMEMSYLGIEPNTVTHNTIIDGYGKARMLEEMESHLSTMLETGKCLPDIYTMNSFVWAYGNNGRIEDMEKWYDEFQHMGIEPDIQTFNILIKSYGKVAMFEKMGLVMNFMKKRFFSPDTVTFNIIIACFGRVGNIEKMEYYFRLMKIQGVKPNSVTYCSVISGYNKAGLLEKVPAIVRQTENTDVVLDAPFFNSVIAAYGQARELKIMEEMFALMKEKNCVPDSVTFATMIRAYSDMGMHEVSKKLEDQMYALESKGKSRDESHALKVYSTALLERKLQAEFDYEHTLIMIFVNTKDDKRFN
ncbi:hypothetical protein ZIOFF_036160 [Zingiber officinale]|uniref:Pentatricopeptide repeat-containing protein n=1 Tax=Zingiber officinale TaxID=94328 RepID=A0A8J5GDF8_ZINOF|nr:hypothetical protein ZIOFF_036160 [Zingiber officinale]